MKPSERYRYHRLAEDLVTEKRFGTALEPANERIVRGLGDEALTSLAQECEQEEIERLNRHRPLDKQPTIEFDSAEVARLCEIERQREIIDRELTGDVEAEKARILEQRQLPEFGVPFGQPPYYGD